MEGPVTLTDRTDIVVLGLASPDVTFTQSVAPGIHRLTQAHTNTYLVESEQGLLLVDAGLPNTYPHLLNALRQLRRTPADLRAIVLTHAHFDHVGMARRLQEEVGCSVHVHLADAYLALHPYRYRHERPRLGYPLRYPKGAAQLLRMARAGALRVRGLDRIPEGLPAGPSELPGRPNVILTQGHTAGHCALDFPDRGATITGDALVTHDPYTGHEGPRIIAGAATADSPRALRSLAAIAELGRRTMLPGHGAAWTGELSDAVAAARAAGRS